MARRVGCRAYAPRRKSSRAIVRSDCGAPLMVTSYARGPARLTPAAPAGAARASPPSASTTTSARRIVTRDQRVDRERYELIVLAPGLDPALEARVRPLLSRHDRWVAHDDPDEYELFNRGARIA